MAKNFECPSCGAAQEYHGGPETSVKCPYCGTTVVVPEELRPARPERPATEFVINVERPGQLPVMLNLPMQGGPALTPAQTRRLRRGAVGCGGCGCLGTFLFVTLFVGFMVYIFGLSIKTNPMYTCAVAEAQKNSAVIQLLGTPITPAFFAWINNYKSSGDYESGVFSTDLSGPKGSGSLRVSGTHDSSSLSLTVTFIQNGRTVNVLSSKTQCR